MNRPILKQKNQWRIEAIHSIASQHNGDKWRNNASLNRHSTAEATRLSARRIPRPCLLTLNGADPRRQYRTPFREQQVPTRVALVTQVSLYWSFRTCTSRSMCADLNSPSSKNVWGILQCRLQTRKSQICLPKFSKCLRTRMKLVENTFWIEFYWDQENSDVPSSKCLKTQELIRKTFCSQRFLISRNIHDIKDWLHYAICRNLRHLHDISDSHHRKLSKIAFSIDQFVFLFMYNLMEGYSRDGFITCLVPITTMHLPFCFMG